MYFNTLFALQPQNKNLTCNTKSIFVILYKLLLKLIKWSFKSIYSKICEMYFVSPKLKI